MMKLALFSINIIGLLLVNLFSDNEIMVENNTPDMLAPGEKKEVRISINKSEVQGFAKLELVLPEGLKVMAGETQGASFTFSDHKARFVWMTLPSEKSFTITYTLESSETAEGMYSINGVFAYIDQSKRVDFAIPVRKVTINKNTPSQQITQSEAIAAKSTDAANNPSMIASSTEAPAATNVEKRTNDPANLIPASVLPATITPSAATIEDIICSRTITKISDTDFRVDLTISGNSIKGFAKILETLPPNCKAEKMVDAGAVVTQEKNSIKFVWFEIPATPTVVVSYRLLCLNAFSSDPQIIGKLSFVENNNPREIPVIFVGRGNSDVALETSKPETVASSSPEAPKTPVSEEVKTEAENENTAQNEKPKVTPKEETPLVKSPKTPVSTVPSVETGITYKVQILAAHRVVNKTYFSNKYSFSEEINIENHEGWVKYTTGKFGEYKKARNERERLKTDYETLPGPFVTAYNDGERITVQEALLISKQQWMQ
ncbi:MAG: hypothetical protein IT223_05720 [Crocinitomicaceae bacterium]|nr:hypothetical protein [Crocinitomicaceae bacterium]